jgi:hypothetical protein
MPRAPAQRTSVGGTQLGGVLAILVGLVVGSLAALYYRGGLQASGRASTAAVASVVSRAAADASFFRSISDATEGLSSGSRLDAASLAPLPAAGARGEGGGYGGCDCEACAALLASLGVAAPAHWGVDECECGTCSALLRLNLQAQGVGGLEVDAGFLAGAFGDVRALHGAMKALGGGTVPPAECKPCSAPAAVAAAAPCPPAPPPCPAAAPCPPPAALPAPAAAPAPAAPCGRSLTGAAPVWPTARTMRAVPPPPCSVAAAFGVGPEACEQRPLAIPTRCVVGRHFDHWDFFTTAITLSREPFALMRYVDGERMILQGTPVGTGTQAWGEDKWQWEGGASRLQQDMLAGLKGHYGEPVFYAVASPMHDEHGLRYYLEAMETTCGQITFANLWINEMYARTKAFLLHQLGTQHARIVLLANHEGVKKFPPCVDAGTAAPGALFGCVAVPDNAVHTWEKEEMREPLLKEALDLADRAPPGSLFIVCAGPLSKPLINALWNHKRAHQYVDFGSSLDEVLKGRKTRPYVRACGAPVRARKRINDPPPPLPPPVQMDPNSPYSKGFDPQWFCHRGAASFNFSRPGEVDFSQPGIEGRCHTFSIPEGE